MKDLKEKTIRGGAARLCAQGANFGFRLISLMVLSRLLGPHDFGLVGMVTAFTGVLGLFRDFGLSSASVQRLEVTQEQISTLFWINILVGIVLAIVGCILAPLIANFYHEPRLMWITVVLAIGFLFNAAGVQHQAILQRELHFTALAVISTLALVLSTVIAVIMAVAGLGYWALVTMTVSSPLISTVAMWIASNWIPGRPHRRVGIRSLVRFGGTVTLNGLVVYVAYNLEKILLGRYWGVDAIGLYSRAYQLVNIPTENLNSAVGEVAFSALARVQNDSHRLRSYFLKGYALVVALTLPITIVCALFANDVILILLGPQWTGTVWIFRLLAPTILIFAMINPFSWLLFSTGEVGRSLKIALVIAPLVISGYLLGLPHGPKGVALGYSVAMTLWIIPHIAWCVHGTVISVRDILTILSRPLISASVAIPLPLLFSIYAQSLPVLIRLAIEVTIFNIVYLGMLLFAMRQKTFYLNLLRGLLKRSEPMKAETLVLA
jgi:O-antigen/teichoic acid export membrane protein